LAIWDQGGIATPDSPFGYGRVYEQNEINEALQTNDPYSHLGYGPSQDTSGTHGTHVMDIAGGNGNGSSTPGVAPNADLIFVHIESSDIDWSGPDVTKTTFGDSVHLLEAAKFIFDRAGDRPCVINISLATNGGPHDGTSLVEQGLDILLNEAPNRSIVIAASNSFDDKIHTSGTVSTDSAVDLIWEVQQNDFTHNELEVWYSGNDVFELDLILPDGTSIGTVPLGTNASFENDTGR
ncbi:MAG: S8 family serine peptidase, partial [Candidatus Aminicenantes bacterium]|nr:S8 family serine peptidase [Candidatus Aminicenantes bacterium]NIN21520.1 S8 family serine peptidase [Candidatus Aminicenantes bacterium]NIN88150.1 S8 family serine peptidase [Candidatus Aminicenantes bacterium]NIO84497.1 S8 family serine peptidase [Candidatus Aminicenantes bacterium]NIQ70438.1 S8 family serine peptidase [Candidatus Aminicenantes bacterium]